MRLFYAWHTTYSGELDIDSLRKEVSVVYDIKGFLPEGVADKRL